MKLIIGGAYQGKLKYAKEAYGVSEGWIDGRTCSYDEIETCRGIFNFHELVKRMLSADEAGRTEGDMKTAWPISFSGTDLSGLEMQAKAFAAALYRKNPDILIVSNELGYGIVPMEKGDRMWREAAGRICTSLAACSDEVVRVVCGLGMRLK